MASERSPGALAPDGSYGSSGSRAEGDSSPQFRPDQVERAMFEIQGEQNLMLGACAGAIAGAVGAIVWAAVTVVMNFQIGWLAVGIGFLVGAGVRWAGRGTTRTFGVIGGSLALVSVLVGNFLSLLGLMADAQGVSYAEMAATFDYSQTLSEMAATFSPIDLVFYGIAVWEGYRFSIREVTPAEIHDRLAAEGVAPATMR